MVDSELIAQVRLKVLEGAIRTAEVPDAGEVAELLGRSPGEVEKAFGHLAETHVYVREPGDARRLRMANPFSGVLP